MIIYSHLQNQDNKHENSGNYTSLWLLQNLLQLPLTSLKMLMIFILRTLVSFSTGVCELLFFYYNEPHFHRKGVNSVHRHMHITQFKYVQIAPRQYFPVGALRITWFYLCILSSHKSNKIILWPWPSASCVCKIDSKQVKGKRTKVKEK